LTTGILLIDSQTDQHCSPDAPQILVAKDSDAIEIILLLSLLKYGFVSMMC